METVKCPSCGSPRATMINENEFRCTYCNHVFTIESPSIDNPSVSDEQPYQDVRQEMYQEQVSYNEPPINNIQGCTKNRNTAGILALLAGGLGVHQFYLGHIIKGLIYLLLCWTYIPGIIGVIEGIILLTQSDEDFARKPRLII